MRPSVVFLIAAFCCAATPVRAAGIQFIDVPIEAENAVLSGAVWYPCAEPAQQVRLHGLSISGTMDCPISGGRFPLVVISHGMTGWVGGHHDYGSSSRRCRLCGRSDQRVASIKEKLPAGTDYHLVSNAGHWAFLAPCTQGQTRSNPRVCVDADGVDRTAFHKEFNAAVLKFFDEHLLDASKP
jgi:predicted dienelactone hydrolase